MISKPHNTNNEDQHSGQDMPTNNPSSPDLGTATNPTLSIDEMQLISLHRALPDTTADTQTRFAELKVKLDQLDPAGLFAIDIAMQLLAAGYLNPDGDMDEQKRQLELVVLTLRKNYPGQLTDVENVRG